VKILNVGKRKGEIGTDVRVEMERMKVEDTNEIEGKGRFISS
jgi:hypothetical protein